MTTNTFETAPRKCLRGTWSIAQMRAAFDAVAPLDNWKLPVRGTVPADKADLTLDAVEWFCGGRATVAQADDTSATIAHPGYYAVVGA